MITVAAVTSFLFCAGPQAGGKRAEYTQVGGGATQADGYSATRLPQRINEWFCS